MFRRISWRSAAGTGFPAGRAYKTVHFEESLMVDLKKKGRGGQRLVEGALLEEEIRSMLPRWMRDVARAGLRNRYTFNLANCHPHDSAFLKNFVAERDAVPAKTHPDRAAAQELYLRLLYGGSVAHKRTTFPMMDYALEFQRMVRALVAEGCSKNRDILRRLRDKTARPRELLCYVLNTAQHRRGSSLTGL